MKYVDGLEKQLRINWGVIRVPFKGADEKLDAENQIKIPIASTIK